MAETAAKWLTYAAAGLLLADFASGFIHWIIDRYCSPSLPLAGKHFVGLIHDHHRRPVAMFSLGLVRRTPDLCCWWRRSSPSSQHSAGSIQ